MTKVHIRSIFVEFYNAEDYNVKYYFDMNIGKTIKQLRTEKGISQLQLGLAIGNDAAYVSRIENDKYEPSLSKILEIAKVLEVDPMDMLGRIVGEK